METVNNLAAAASRAIWGDKNSTNEAQTGANSNVAGNETKGQEPVSGQLGDVEAGEPYDKGNAETTATDNTTDDITNTSTLTSNPKPTISTNPDAPGNTPATGEIRPEHKTDKTGVTSANQPSSATMDQKPTSSNDNSGPGAAPSVGADPSSAQQPTQKQQGADRPSDEPSGGESERIRETKKEAEDAAGVDVSGPGPQSLAEKARENGGVAGGSGKKGGDGDDDGPQKESQGEGTGEKWVKSSGMKADGGDFDASNPGAGREADRLLDEKGVRRAQPGQVPPAGKEEVGGGADSKASKPPLGEKIKAKLHIKKDKD